MVVVWTVTCWLIQQEMLSSNLEEKFRALINPASMLTATKTASILVSLCVLDGRVAKHLQKGWLWPREVASRATIIRARVFFSGCRASVATIDFGHRLLTPCLYLKKPNVVSASGLFLSGSDQNARGLNLNASVLTALYQTAD